MMELVVIFFFNDTATTEIYTLSLHDALPIYEARLSWGMSANSQRYIVVLLPRRLHRLLAEHREGPRHAAARDRKSTRLNSSHANISYAAFCLKKKNYPMPPVNLLSRP